jgi:cell division protein FtsB
LKFRKNNHRKKGKSKLFGFFYRYWFTFVLLVIAITLIRQGIFINQFPQALENKRLAINETASQTDSLILKNKSLLVELQNESASNLEVLESQARFRFGFVKEGEVYYQIRKSGQDSATGPSENTK